MFHVHSTEYICTVQYNLRISSDEEIHTFVYERYTVQYYVEHSLNVQTRKNSCLKVYCTLYCIITTTICRLIQYRTIEEREECNNTVYSIYNTVYIKRGV